MPNYCDNQVTIKHADVNQIAVVKLAVASNKLFDTLVPLAADQDPRVEWGCKWDAWDLDLMEIDENTVSITYSSAWCPPIELYHKLVSRGYDVTAYYYEPGCLECGKFENGTETDYNLNDLESIPMYVQEMFAFGEYGEDDDCDDCDDCECGSTKTYRVEVKEVHTYTVEVTASDQEDAIQQAIEYMGENDGVEVEYSYTMEPSEWNIEVVGEA